MRRPLLAVVLVVVLGPACRSAGPPAPRGPATLPPPLAEYQGETLILRHQGDQRTVEARPGQPLSGGCDVAVHVRSVLLGKGEARFTLDTVGLPKIQGRPADCTRTQPGLTLRLRGLTGTESPDDVRARVDALLQTADAYLGSKGVAFELPPGEAPTDVASREVFSGTAELSRGRQVSVWPRKLLSVDPWYHHGSDRIHQEGEIEVVAVVGTDGRLHEPEVKTGLSASQQNAVLRVLPLWRFDPAKDNEGPVGARMLLRPLLRIF